MESSIERNCAKASKDKNHTLVDDVEEFDSNEVEDYSVYEEYLEENGKDIYEVPLFDGNSKMTARARFPAKRFDIWAEVSTVCGQGALVSASGTRDHLWLGFLEERAVLRWDSGSGPFELHTGRVKTDSKSKISARRYKRDAVLKLGSSMARGTAQGRMTSLDVDPFIYIGHPPENVTKLSGATGIPGFVGCVHRLRVSGRDLIPPSRGLTVTSSGLKSCTPHNLAQLVCP